VGVVGLALGFGGGYFFAGRPGSVADVPAASAGSASAAREFTDAQVKPVTEPANSQNTGAARSTAPGAPAPNAQASTSGPAPSISSSSAVRSQPSSRDQPNSHADARGSTSSPRAESATPEPDATRGRVLVRSTPADATVLVDGRDRGRTP